jgi:hypothetical protein
MVGGDGPAAGAGIQHSSDDVERVGWKERRNPACPFHCYDGVLSDELIPTHRIEPIGTCNAVGVEVKHRFTFRAVAGGIYI